MDANQQPTPNPLRVWADSLVTVTCGLLGWLVKIEALPGSSPLIVARVDSRALAEEERRRAVRVVEAIAREALLRDWTQEENSQ